MANSDEDKPKDLTTKESDTTPKEANLKTAEPDKHKFGQCSDTSSPEFNFKKVLEHLPFKINIRKALLSQKQQDQFIDLIYDYQHVFFGCCSQTL